MSYADLDENDGPEGRSLAERCMISFASIVPSLPSLYNNTIQIVQSPTHVWQRWRTMRASSRSTVSIIPLASASGMETQ
jgi:hypothetical protein